MPLAAGTRLGSYEITGLIATGGMGEVYRASDTNLRREVAVKVLPADVADDDERLARFEREARVLGSLNHQNIATIHGLERFGRTCALIMELVPGPTLAHRIAEGPLELPQALSIAGQVANALEAAHERGIIHRDLKPANIKVRPDGTVKVLDFGLARIHDAAGESSTRSVSPTITSPAVVTGAGVLLGTAAYMSPEQARGRSVDPRTDIWAFGCVLYEMLTGTRAFDGDDVTEALAAVLKTEPSWKALPPGTPPSLSRLLRRALEKDPKHRLAHIADARLELAEARRELDSPPDAATGVSPRGWTRREVALALAALVLTGAAGMLSWLGSRPEPPDASLRADDVYYVPLPAGAPGAPFPALAPDGSALAFVWPSDQTLRIWIRKREVLVPTPLRGTDGLQQRFWWSADSRSLAFVRDGLLWTIAATGGPPREVAFLGDGSYAGAWGSAGVMLLGSASGGGLLQVSAEGAVTQATELDPERKEWLHTTPSFLPDGRHFLFLALGSDGTNAAYIGSVDSTDRRLLRGVASEVRYAPTGHILFIREGALMAQRFDPSALTTEGEPVPIVDPFVAADAIFSSGFSAAADGRLAYYSATAVGSSRLAWFDEDGNELGTAAPPGRYVNPELSADDRLIAYDTGGGPVGDVWVYDVMRKVRTKVTTHPANDGLPQWSPRDELAFISSREKVWNVYVRNYDSTSVDIPLLVSPQDKRLWDWSQDGKYIVFSAEGDIWAMEARPGSTPWRVTNTAAAETNAKVSATATAPLIAYQSAVGPGAAEVFVQSFPEGDVRRQVSSNGGGVPRWSADGKALYYIDGDRWLIKVPIDSKGEIGEADPLFQLPTNYQAGRSYAVASDGRLLVRVPEVSAPPSIVVDLNWTSRLPELMSPGRLR